MLKTNLENSMAVIKEKGVASTPADIDAFVDAFFADGPIPTKAVETNVVPTAPKSYKEKAIETAKEKAKAAPPMREFRLPNGQMIKGYNAEFSGSGELLSVDGKQIAMTAEERKKAKRGGNKGGGTRKDAGRDFVTELAIEALTTTLAKVKLEFKQEFKHSKEGHVFRCEESDYGVRVSKSKEAKFDITEEGFEAEVSYTTRGKAKHRGSTIARLLVRHIEKAATDHDLTIADVKASGVVVHYAGAEYTIKIAKKRDRVGFEGERADAF